MENVSVNTQGIANVGADIAALANEFDAAAASVAAAAPELLCPIFGVVGSDFLATYAAAHAGHVAGIGQLSTVLASLSTAVASAADSYTQVDDARAAALRAASETPDSSGGVP